MLLTQALVDRLACPVCYGKLLLASTHIDCRDCTRRYPIVDDLPVLIASRATIIRMSDRDGIS